MSNNQLEIRVELNDPYTFVSTLGLEITIVSSSEIVFYNQFHEFFTFSGVAGAIIDIPVLPPGSYRFDCRNGYSVLDPDFPISNSGGGGVIGTTTFKVNSSPESSASADFVLTSSPFTYGLQSTVIFDVACLHGSSLIKMKDGFKRIDRINVDDEVLSFSPCGKEDYAKVKGISHCWLSFQGVDHDAIIFEKDSLGINEPSEQLIIDPGHPMCTRTEYLEKGSEALRPAGTFWEEFKGDKIYTKKWTDVFVESRRYDLILEEPFNTYVANGIIVKAKHYKDHRYKQFV